MSSAFQSHALSAYAPEVQYTRMHAQTHTHTDMRAQKSIFWNGVCYNENYNSFTCWCKLYKAYPAAFRNNNLRRHGSEKSIYSCPFNIWYKVQYFCSLYKFLYTHACWCDLFSSDMYMINIPLCTLTDINVYFSEDFEDDEKYDDDFENSK